MSLTASISSFLLAVLLCGCATAPVAPDPPILSADTIIETATVTHATGMDVFNKFGAFMDDVEGFLEDQPKVQKLGDEIKTNGEDWLYQLDVLTANFKAKKTEENRIRLEEMIAVVQSAISGAQSVPGALSSKPKTERKE